MRRRRHGVDIAALREQLIQIVEDEAVGEPLSDFLCRRVETAVRGHLLQYQLGRTKVIVKRLTAGLSVQVLVPGPGPTVQTIHLQIAAG